MEHMQGQDNYFVLEIPSKPENVAFVRQTVAIFAAQLDFTIDEIDEIKVAVSEVVSNAVIHGYRGTTGIVRVEARLVDGRLAVTVSDRGVGIEDVEWAAQPTHTTQPEERMGLGLVFAREYMDELVIDSRPGQGTTVQMFRRVRSESLQY